MTVVVMEESKLARIARSGRELERILATAGPVIEVFEAEDESSVGGRSSIGRAPARHAGDAGSTPAVRSIWPPPDDYDTIEAGYRA